MATKASQNSPPKKTKKPRKKWRFIFPQVGGQVGHCSPLLQYTVQRKHRPVVASVLMREMIGTAEES